MGVKCYMKKDIQNFNLRRSKPLGWVRSAVQEKVIKTIVFLFPFPNWSWACHDGRGDNIRRAQYVTKAQKEELVIIGDGR